MRDVASLALSLLFLLFVYSISRTAFELAEKLRARTIEKTLTIWRFRLFDFGFRGVGEARREVNSRHANVVVMILIASVWFALTRGKKRNSQTSRSNKSSEDTPEPGRNLLLLPLAPNFNNDATLTFQKYLLSNHSQILRKLKGKLFQYFSRQPFDISVGNRKLLM